MLTSPRLRSGNASMIKTTGSFLGTVMTGRAVLGAIHPFLQRFPGFAALAHSPGPQKNGFGSAQGFSNGFGSAQGVSRGLFYTSHFATKSIQPCSYGS